MAEIVPGFKDKGIVIDGLDHQILAGNVFSGGFFDPSIAFNASLLGLLRIGSLPVAVRVDTYAGGSAIGEIYKGPTVTADGTPRPLVNRNQVKAINKGPPLSTLFNCPTVTANGTPLFEGVYMPGGTGVPRETVGGEASSRILVLESNTEYLIELLNIAQSTQPMSMRITLAEGTMDDTVEGPEPLFLSS